MMPWVCYNPGSSLLTLFGLGLLEFNGRWLWGGLLAVVCGLAAWRLYRRHRRRSVFQRIRCSVLMLRQGTLCVRTLGEMPLQRLGCKGKTRRQLVRAAASAPRGQALPVLDTDDAHELRAAIAGYLSGLTPIGHLQQAQGLPTVTGDFVAGLISDHEKPPHQRRLRLLVVPQRLLENLPEDPPQYEQADAAEFWHWAQDLSRTWQENPVALARVELAFAGVDL